MITVENVKKRIKLYEKQISELKKESKSLLSQLSKYEDPSVREAAKIISNVNSQEIRRLKDKVIMLVKHISKMEEQGSV